jgi:hypothetical protein
MFHNCSGGFTPNQSHVRLTHPQTQTIMTSAAGHGDLVVANVQVYRQSKEGRARYGEAPAGGHTQGQMA